MAKGLKGKSLGAWIFLIGVVLAIILVLFSANLGTGIQGIVLAVLIIIGLVIGFVNVSGGETQKFLLAGVILVIVSAMGGNAIPSGTIGGYVTAILNALLILFVPATIVVALKSIFAVARS